MEATFELESGHGASKVKELEADKEQLFKQVAKIELWGCLAQKSGLEF